MEDLPVGVAGGVNVGVGVAHFEVDQGGLGLGLVVVACCEVGHGDGVEIALGSLRSGDGGGGSSQGSSNGGELHFDGLKFGRLCEW